MINIIRKIFALILSAALVFILCACDDGFTDTPESEQAIADYTAAVQKSLQRSGGTVVITTVAKDDIIEKKESETVIEFQYTISGDDVSFTRSDYTDGELTVMYRTQGDVVEKCLANSTEWVDDTQANRVFLKYSTNPVISMSLFRADNKKKISKRFFESISREQSEQGDFIRFKLKNSEVSTVMNIIETKGAKRQSAEQVRDFYINDEGYIEKIVISAVQSILYNGRSGEISSVITAVYK